MLLTIHVLCGIADMRSVNVLGKFQQFKFKLWLRLPKLIFICDANFMLFLIYYGVNEPAVGDVNYE